jgi:hypothetical protein
VSQGEQSWLISVLQYFADEGFSQAVGLRAELLVDGGEDEFVVAALLRPSCGWASAHPEEEKRLATRSPRRCGADLMGGIRPGLLRVLDAIGFVLLIVRRPTAGDYRQLFTLILFCPAVNAN